MKKGCTFAIPFDERGTTTEKVGLETKESSLKRLKF